MYYISTFFLLSLFFFPINSIDWLEEVIIDYICCKEGTLQMEKKRQKVIAKPNDKELPKFSIDLIPDWKLIITNKGNKFYHNCKTLESKWVLNECEDEKVLRYVDDELDKDPILVLIAKARGLKIAEDREIDQDKEDETINDVDVIQEETRELVSSSMESSPVASGLVAGYGSSSDEEEEDEEDGQSKGEEEENGDSSAQIKVHADVPDAAPAEVESEREEEDSQSEEEENEENGLNLSDLEGLSASGSDSEQSGEDNDDIDIISDLGGSSPHQTGDNSQPTIDLRDKQVLKFLNFLETRGQELGITPYSSWDLEISKLVECPEFYLLDDDSIRREVFDHWCGLAIHGGDSNSNNEEEVEGEEHDSKNNEREEEEEIRESDYPTYQFVKYIVSYQESRKPKKAPKYFVEFKRLVRSDPRYKELAIEDEKLKEKIYKKLIKLQDLISSSSGSGGGGGGDRSQELLEIIVQEVQVESRRLSLNRLKPEQSMSIDTEQGLVNSLGRSNYTNLARSCISITLLDLTKLCDANDALKQLKVKGIVSGLI